MSTLPNPLIQRFLSNQLDSRALQAPALGTSIGLPNAVPGLPAPIGPPVSQRPPRQSEIAQDKYAAVVNAPDTISGIHNPLGRGVARAADITASVFAPRLAQYLPGTTLNHQREVSIAANNAKDAEAQDQATAALGETEAKTKASDAMAAYTSERPDIERGKVRQHLLTSLAPKGFTVSDDPNSPGGFAIAEDPESQAFKDREALSEMHLATAEKDAITGEIAQNKYKPGTQEYRDAQRRLDQVDKRLSVSMGSLGLRAQSLALRRENMDASLYGTGPDGKPIAGSAQIVGDDGTATTVGSKFAPTAIKQQKTVTSFNDLSGSVTHLRDAIKAYEAEGGDMSDAHLAAAAADPKSTVGKVIQGKLVTGGLSPTAINLLNAQRQTMEQAGILRSTTGGTSSEAGAQRILEVVPKFGSDTNASAYNKLIQQEEVLKRLAPGQTRVTGGASVQHSAKQAPAEPKVGDIVDGYKYKGGGAHDAKNWVKQ